MQQLFSISFVHCINCNVDACWCQCFSCEFIGCGPSGGVGCGPVNKPVVYRSFANQAHRWDRPRRVVAKVQWHQGELFPRVGFIVTNLDWSAKRVTRFYNRRGLAEQWIKKGRYALNWTRLSCHGFEDNQVRLRLFVLACNLGNFLRRLVLPTAVKHRSLTTMRDKLVKIGVKIVRHARYVTFQLAEVAVPRDLFR